MGSSRPWGEAMQTITRGTSGFTDKLDAQALLDYFKPLQVKSFFFFSNNVSKAFFYMVLRKWIFYGKKLSLHSPTILEYT